MAKTYGLMFKDEMIRAYLAGVKTQTRRLKGLGSVNENPGDIEFVGIVERDDISDSYTLFRCVSNNQKHYAARLPYGGTSDTLWFKETYQTGPGLTDENKTSIYYRADATFEVKKWKSSMFMPRKYARFQEIPIVSVRVERLQDITPADAFAEGVRTEYLHQKPDWLDVDRYHELWDRINGKTFPWSSNPWVWVYEFPKHNKEQS